jgi:CubicO group peptidase (beta-lactamase class C family)
MRSLLVLILAASSAFSGFTQVSPQAVKKSDAERHLDQRVPIWLKAFNVVGVEIAYIEDGKIAWTSFYGEQVPGGPPTSEKTLFNVASLTKPISAEVILRLASDGKVNLDEPVAPYWTDPDVKDNAWNELLTPRLLLSHQSGFTNWRYQTKGVLQFQLKPGTQFGYSGEGIDYVARFAEKKAGQPFEELAQQFVFDPIGMKDTSYTPRSWWAGRQAKPVESEPRTKWSAADLLRTTVRDYSKFVISVMNNEGVTKEIAAERLKITRNQITPEMESVLCESAQDPEHCKVSMGFGLGWRIVKIDNETIIDHTGGDSDIKTIAFFIPRTRTGVVIFTNGPNVGHEMIDKILGVIYPNPIYDAVVWR